MRNTGVQVIPGVTNAAAVKKQTLNKIPEEDNCKVPLIHSLLAVKAEQFEIIFDDKEDIQGNVVG
jgi:hypothetical protein